MHVILIVVLMQWFLDRFSLVCSQVNAPINFTMLPLEFSESLTESHFMMSEDF